MMRFFRDVPERCYLPFFPSVYCNIFLVDDRSPEGGKQLAVRLFIQIYYDILL